MRMEGRGPVWMGDMGMEAGRQETCFGLIGFKRAWSRGEIFRKLKLKGPEKEMIGGKGRCGWKEAVYKACFRVSLKHASLWGEILKKLRLKGLQMDMIVGERGVDVGGQISCTKHVSGLVSNMLRCGVKYLRN